MDFLEKLRPIAITSPTDFIEVRELRVPSPLELFEGEARDFRHHIVDRRLE